MRFWLWLILLSSLTACGGDPVCGDGDVWLNTEECDDGDQQDGDGCDRNCRLEDGPTNLLGDWSTNFGTTVTITQERWDGKSIHTWLAADRIVVVRQPEDAEWNRGTYSKLVYTELAPVSVEGRTVDGFYVCEIAFGRETASEALNDEAIANAENPAERGCGDFGWTLLTRVSD